MNIKILSFVVVLQVTTAVLSAPAEPLYVNPCLGIMTVQNVPNPEDCTRFYICINQQPFPGTCAPGLIFDVLTMACNRAEDSVCIVDLPSPPTAAPASESFENSELVR
ncbi:uncharacterized protein LOC128092781 [Culex pipiens pallens]|uniref:uncharacterized protein LOC128092781 n=1 Tax=Culex pipiens pallens TaxID=42434 RepID=UPI0022AA81BA|nr:uncharacterized protein LOC128092781 [Culex pipiens pallens]